MINSIIFKQKLAYYEKGQALSLQKCDFPHKNNLQTPNNFLYL